MKTARKQSISTNLTPKMPPETIIAPLDIIVDPNYTCVTELSLGTIGESHQILGN